MYKSFLISILLALVVTLSFGQEKTELEKRMQKTNEEIQLANQLLAKNKNKQKTGLNNLLVIKRRIALRESLIGDLSLEIDIINRHIQLKQDTIKVYEHRLEKLRTEYAKMIYFAYKNKSNYDKLMFILAAEDFNQAYRRMKYFEQYTKYRKRQANLILGTRKNLEYEIGELTDYRLEKEEAVNKKEREKTNLASERRNQQTSISRLQNQQDDLRRKLMKAERVRKQLQKAIADLIAKEAEGNSFYKKLNTEESRVSSGFVANKGQHVWPVKSFVIISRFGIHNHPILKGIKINNEGIDVSALTNATTIKDALLSLLPQITQTPID